MKDPQFWTFLGALAGALATIVGSFFVNRSNKSNEERKQDADIEKLNLAVELIAKDIKGCREDIARLEKKQDRYNNLQERTIKNEADIAVLKRGGTIG